MSITRFEANYGGQGIGRVTSLRVRWEPETMGPEERIIYSRQTWSIESVMVRDTTQTPGEFQSYWQSLRQLLGEDGRDFEVVLRSGGGVAQQLVKHTALLDANRGPRVMRANVREFSGGRAARITFEIELAIPPQKASGYLAMSWSELMEIDNRFLTTRTVRGSVRFHPKKIADPRFEIEKWFPPLTGFKRTRARTTQRDGAEVLFELVDAEVYYALPPPIANGQATFKMAVKADKDKKTRYEKSFAAWYEPPKTGDIQQGKKATAEMLIAMADSRFPQEDGFLFVLQSLEEDVFGGRIQIEYAGYRANSGDFYFLADYETVFAKPVAGAGEDPKDFGPGGTANVAARAGNPLAGTGVGGAAGAVGSTSFPGGTKPGARVAGAAVSVELDVTWAYRTKHYRLVLPTKGSGPDIIQETRHPSLIITETGSAMFLNQLPKSAAEMAIGSLAASANVFDEEYVPGMPYQDAAGQWVYPVEWMVQIYEKIVKSTYEDAVTQAEAVRKGIEDSRRK